MSIRGLTLSVELWNREGLAYFHISGFKMFHMSSNKGIQLPTPCLLVPSVKFGAPKHVFPISVCGLRRGCPHIRDPRSAQRQRKTKRTQASIISASLCVDPSLPLWQQPAVHSAFGQCALAVLASFLAASLLSALLEKAANKVSLE